MILYNHHILLMSHVVRCYSMWSQSAEVQDLLNDASILQLHSTCCFFTN